MALTSRQLLLARLATVFPDSATAEQALQSLDRYKEQDGPAVDAVQLAILKLCDGQLSKLRELVQAARRDFRDVLYPAQSDQKEWIAWIGSHGP